MAVFIDIYDNQVPFIAENYVLEDISMLCLVMENEQFIEFAIGPQKLHPDAVSSVGYSLKSTKNLKSSICIRTSI